MSDDFDRALKFAVAFWLVVLAAILWYWFIRPGPMNLLVPTYWYVNPSALTPFSVFFGADPNAPVGDTDAIIPAFITMFVILMVWIVQMLALTLVPAGLYYGLATYRGGGSA